MILVVDDEQLVRAQIGRALVELGYPVEEAESGAAAIEMVRARRPQLVILDYVMPEMDGAETARELLTLYPDLPIVFSTGHGPLRALRDAAGNDASVLQKPFTLTELDDLVTKALRSPV